ncbi:MAG TPA: hypothetical protein VFZ66_13475 [Herpetosiphonaceae bacterium]
MPAARPGSDPPRWLRGFRATCGLDDALLGLGFDQLVVILGGGFPAFLGVGRCCRGSVGIARQGRGRAATVQATGHAVGTGRNGAQGRASDRDRCVW